MGVNTFRRCRAPLLAMRVVLLTAAILALAGPRAKGWASGASSDPQAGREAVCVVLDDSPSRRTGSPRGSKASVKSSTRRLAAARCATTNAVSFTSRRPPASQTFSTASLACPGETVFSIQRTNF